MEEKILGTLSTTGTPDYEEVQISIEHIGQSHLRRNVILSVAAVFAVAFLILAGIYVYSYVKAITIPDLPVSTNDAENIAKLSASSSVQDGSTPGVTLTTDSINQVPFNLYHLHGLSAELTYECPSQSDNTIYLYSFCADYRADNGQTIGDCIIRGRHQGKGRLRTGYLAANGGNMVIGVSTTSEVCDFCREHEGYFFRQFALVSAGQVGDIRLKGKVHRRALARTDSDEFYYIQSLNRESLYDFSEAIADYGFTDAIYLTGGDAQGFYRDSTGTAHTIGNPTILSTDHKLLYLVFKAKK